MACFKKGLDLVLSQFVIAIFILLVMCVIWQVLARWLGVSSTFTEELAKFMFIWTSIFAASLAHSQKRHLAIDLLTAKLCGTKKMISNIVIHLLVIAFAALIMVYGGGKAVLNTQGQLSSVMKIPMYFIYLVVPLNGLFILFYSANDLIKTLKGQDEAAPNLDLLDAKLPQTTPQL